MTHPLFMAIWGGILLFILAGLAFAWVQKAIRASRQTDPADPGAIEDLKRHGVRRLEVRHLKGDPATQDPGVLVLEGHGYSRIFDYEIYRAPHSPELQAQLEDFVARFDRQG